MTFVPAKLNSLVSHTSATRQPHVSHTLHCKPANFITMYLKAQHLRTFSRSMGNAWAFFVSMTL